MPIFGQKVASLPNPAGNVVISPDHKLIATAAFNGTINFFDATTFEPAGDPLTGGTAFAAQITFTPDGRTIITSGLDSILRLFDVARPTEGCSASRSTPPRSAAPPVTSPVAI